MVDLSASIASDEQLVVLLPVETVGLVRLHVDHRTCYGDDHLYANQVAWQL
jgi:hypothetical protein